MLLEIFQYEFMQNALYAIILSSLICSIIGTYIVIKRLVFISDGIAHNIFAGVGIAHYFGFDILKAAFIAGMISILIFEFLQRKMNERKDAVIGILLTAGMSIGVIFIYLTPGYATDLFSYLFGNILMVSKNDIYIMFGFAFLLIVWFVIFFQCIRAISFDEEFSNIIGLPVAVINIIMLLFVCLSIVILIKITGIILVIAMLIIPPSIANQFTYKYEKIIIFSTIISLVVSFCGLILSYFYDLPAGSTIVLTLSLFYIFSMILKLYNSSHSKY